MLTTFLRRAFFWTAWHTLAAVALVSVVSVRQGLLPWQVDPAQAKTAGLLVGGYLLGAAVLHVRTWLERENDLVEVPLAAAAGYAPVFLYVIVANVQMSRLVLLAAFATGVGLLGAVHLLRRFRRALLGLLALGVAGGLVLIGTTGLSLQAPTGGPGQAMSDIDTSLYPVRATYYRNHIPRTASYHAGGGLARLEGGFLLATADGALHAFELPGSAGSDGALEVDDLEASVPLNRDAFASAAGRGDYTNYFRVLDILVDHGDESLRVFASHHHWRPEEECFVVRVSMAEGEPGASLDEVLSEGWSTVHETEPCLPLKVEENPQWPFRGMEGGGRMALVGEERLLLTVGDQGFNRVRFEPGYVQDEGASYGKTVLVDLSDGSWRPYTVGHRNPQGLWVGASDSIWLTEHGPRGGDEMNRLVEGRNYGWPLVSHGTDYGDHAWPLNERQGRHEGFEMPVYTWVPAIAVSDLVRLDGRLFSAWAGDFLVASLKDNALYRMRVDGDRVVLAERIAVGERVRDLAEAEDGRIVLWTDSYDIVVLEPSTMEFARCSGCHSVQDGTSHGLGPDLGGLFDREIASAPGYDYSEALRELEGEWTEERLDRFLEDPQGFAPGTTMRMEGIRDPEVRDAIIDYLRSR